MNDIVTVDSIIQNTAPFFVKTVSEYQWNLIPDSQLHAAKQALTKSDYIEKIAKANPDAVHDALMQAAILGLDLTAGKNQGWLLPRKNQQGKTVIQLQVGYKGVEAIHQKTGVIDRLVIRAVRENDVFEWSGDDQEKPKHEANWFATDEERGPIQGAYAITYYPDKTINVTVTPISEIYEKHRDHSDSWRSYLSKLTAHEADPNRNKKPFPPPWLSHEKAMIEKTMAYIASKQWPANIRDEGLSSKILETLHEVDVADYSLKFTPEQRQAFYDFIENNDCLGLFLFSRRLDTEGYVALFNTFKRGTKTEMKQKVREMEEIGAKTFQEIEAAIVDKDAHRLYENLEDCLDVTTKLVKNRLDTVEQTVFDELLAEIDLVSQEKLVGEEHA